MTHKSVLGKGLDALLPDDDEDEGEFFNPALSPLKKDMNVLLLPLELLESNPDQPRKTFEKDALEELAASIREHGIIEPIIVEKTGDTYTIIAGERRARAARLAGLTEAPVLVRNFSDAEKPLVTLIENIQREDLNAVEEARAYSRLLELTGFSQEELATRLGKNRTTVANSLRLLKLEKHMLDALASGQLTAGHGRALLAVEDRAEREALFEQIMGGNLSVRAAEIAARGRGRSAEKKPPKKREPELDSLEEKLIAWFGTKVRIDGTLESGRIVIDYYNMEDLERLYEKIGADEL
jgi:ParB family chromosome partitioning protein